MAYDPQFSDTIEHSHTDEDDLANRMFAAEEQQRRDRSWADAEELADMAPIEDKPPAELRYAAE